ncbi:hypothetical protein CONCODRAFT_77760 [Conidiobolus coronatus NRRL 28638]|uniref:Uncharacterized protein n=1 Tax=Conidiobolus coronatus (strain ATCC 28846 / CBS 209.66 / NRRL 28638) TaxID=796925 RepID=A0A137PBY0_CONC2|nr:hypothetical protein CONCODRAFT_77760 [Conidiobolus coronatus NRRL 28638]|eukprot:KXN72475.1 hypothetical protein CONCODRAFT_77760 [Conidiobolus coronatus NRRL 28638]
MIIELLEYKSTATKVYFGVYALETYLNARQHRKLLETEMPEALEEERQFELGESRYRFIKGAWKVAKNIVFIQYDIYPQIWRYSSDLLVEYFNLGGAQWYTDYFIATAIFPIADAITGLPVMLYDLLVLKRYKIDCSTGCKSIRRPPQANIDLGLSTALDILPQLYLINQGIPNSYLYVWLFRLARNAIGTLLPEIITQSFLKTDLLRDEELITEIEALTKKVDFPLKKILVFQSDVQDSGTPDVYIFENFNAKSIFLSNTFIKKATKEEVCALVSRELGTRRCYYGLKKFLLNEACSLGIVYAFSNVIQNRSFYHQFGFDRMAVIFGATMFKILITPLKPVANSLFNLISRKMHLEANSFAKSHGYSEALKSGLIKSYANRMQNFNDDPLYSIYRSQSMTLAENLQSISKTE